MKRCRVWLLLLACAVTPWSTAQAAPTWTAVGLITSFWTMPEGAVQITTSATPLVTQGCTNDGNGYYWVNPTAANATISQATLLAAYLGGRHMSLSVSGCYGGFAQVYEIYVDPH